MLKFEAVYSKRIEGKFTLLKKEFRKSSVTPHTFILHTCFDSINTKLTWS